MKEDNGIFSEKGFTLVEVMIAVAILTFGLFGVLGMVGTTTRAVESAKRQTQALNLASEKMESIKTIPYANIQSSGTDGGIERTCNGTAPNFSCSPSGVTLPTLTIDNVSYNWSWTVTFIDLDGDGTTLEGTIFDSKDIKKIAMSVSWTDLLGSHTTTLTVFRKI